jgi:hypothetical protein
MKILLKPLIYKINITRNSMKIKLSPKFNKANKQISFDLKKRCLPKELKDRLPNLKGIKLDLDDFEFD